MNKNNNNGFTLVELIVVVIILAILGTIAFVSIIGYSKNSRDSVRITDLKNIESSIAIYSINKTPYPVPDGAVAFVYSGATGWNQGNVGENVITNLELINKIPVDPLTGNEYTYSTTVNSLEYQLGAIYEGDVAFSPIDSTYAADKTTIPLLRGDYNGKFLRVCSGDTCSFIATPSIIASNITNTGILSQINSGTLVYEGSNNLPHSYNGRGYVLNGGTDFYPNDNIIMTGATSDDFNRDTVRLEFATNLQNSYSGSIYNFDTEFEDFLEVDLSTSPDIGKALVGNYVLHGIGGMASTTGTNYAVVVSTSTGSTSGSGCLFGTSVFGSCEL